MLRDIAYFGVIVVFVLMAGAAMFSGAGATTGLALGVRLSPYSCGQAVRLMARSRSSAKQAGASFERAIADYLAVHVDDRIDRMVKRGTKDRGDIAGLRHMGERIVVETKDYGGQIKAAVWTREAHIEAGNDDALIGLVVAKRQGVTDPGRQWVLMELDDLVALLTGERPKEPQ